MATFGRKLTQDQVKTFGRKISNASINFGRKAGDGMERIGPAIAITGLASGNPALATAGTGIGMAGKAMSALLKKD